MLKKSLIVLAMLLTAGSVSAAVTVVRDSKAHATIVTPDNPTRVVQYAATELRYHIKESTGVELPVETESRKPSTGDIIYLGPCKATLAAGIDASLLAPNASRIKLAGHSLFIAGNDSDGSVVTEPYGITMVSYTRMGTLMGVYEFLESQLDVKWLWPGKLGEVIPRHGSIIVKKWDKTYVPKLIHKRLRDGGPYHGVPGAWSSEAARVKFVRDQSIWLRRQRVVMGINMDASHSFTDYWSKYGKTNPDFFAQLPDGTRRPDPTYWGGSPELISMCVSNPGLHRQIVEKWKATRSDLRPFVDASENDTSGKCMCARCTAWDVPDPKDPAAFSSRLDQATKAFNESNNGWSSQLGSVSDRYAKYYLAVQQEARRFDPNAVVMGLAYANYWAPPVKTKLNDKVIIAIVPNLMFPWSDQKRDEFRKQWSGWASTGCKLMLRPNYTLDGQCMPIFYARKFGEDFNYAAKHGLIATDFDSLTGQYAIQGPNMYMLARMQAHPDMSPQKILDEYYGAFGKAESSVRAYFSFWEKISNEVKKAEGDFARFNRVARTIFTPEVMATGWALLNRARVCAQGDRAAEQRVAFLEKGLKNADLTLRTQDAYVKYQQTGDKDDYFSAIRELDAFRAAVDGDNVANMGFLHWAEGNTWDRSFVRLFKGKASKLDTNWKFTFDPEDKGLQAGWNTEQFDASSWPEIRVDSSWESQQIGKSWRNANGNDYDGFAWYRTTFTLDPKNAGKSISILFEAVDEACKIWLNGKQVLDRSYPYNGNINSWQEAFDVDITQAIRFDGPNSLAVRVEDRMGAGGIWKPVWLEISDLP